MEDYQLSKHPTFYAVGLSYRKADAQLRGKFSLDVLGVDRLTIKAKSKGFDGLLVITTCNRTELYGFAQNPHELLQLLCEQTDGAFTELQEVAYVYKNYEAISHLFKVGTGLDSQILGDFEITSQIKQSFYRAKKHGMANPFIERLCNSVLQASKRIKNETELSTGATSVAFASVKYILNKVPDIQNKNILLFGTGKIGRNTCKNLLKHTNKHAITLINRTKENAKAFGTRFELSVKDFNSLQSEIRKCDVLVVATGAQLPTISKALIFNKKPLLILDLSIPKNVAEDVRELPNVSLVHLDELSQITDETLERRKQFIPQATQINYEMMQEFNQWLETRKFAPVIKALKNKLITLKDEELNFHSKKVHDFDSKQAEVYSERIIQKITKQFANHLRKPNVNTDESLQLIQDIFQLKINA